MTLGAAIKAGGVPAALTLAVGLVLLVIGIRFAVTPEDAAETFGVDPQRPQFELHQAIALRDIWLAAILIGLAMMQHWRALALVLGLGTFVCLGDALIAARSSGEIWIVAFHLGAGMLCAGLAGMLWRLGLHNDEERRNVRP